MWSVNRLNAQKLSSGMLPFLVVILTTLFVAVPTAGLGEDAEKKQTHREEWFVVSQDGNQTGWRNLETTLDETALLVRDETSFRLFGKQCLMSSKVTYDCKPTLRPKLVEYASELDGVPCEQGLIEFGEKSVKWRHVSKVDEDGLPRGTPIVRERDTPPPKQIVVVGPATEAIAPLILQNPGQSENVIYLHPADVASPHFSSRRQLTREETTKAGLSKFKISPVGREEAQCVFVLDRDGRVQEWAADGSHMTLAPCTKEEALAIKQRIAKEQEQKVGAKSTHMK